MTPVDSPPQVAPLDVRVMGVVVRIAAEDDETRGRLARQWSRARVETTDDDPAVTLTVAPSVPASQAASDYLLTTRVTLAGLTATAGRRLNLHAGGLADDRGRVLALVAASGTGKTTATRVLARRLGYVSDETVSVDPDGTVTPHPKPLSVVTDPARPMDKEQHSPDDLGLVTTPVSGRLARLVVLHRDTEAPRGLVRLGALRGMLDLIEQSSSLAQLDDPLRTLYSLVAACGGVWSLGYEEIADEVDGLVALLDEEAPPGPQPETVWHPGSSESAVTAGDGPLVGRLPWVDAVEIDDEVVVLTESKAWLLADLTATVWLHLELPRTVDELVEAAQRRHGEHPDARAIVEGAIATLAEEDLVVRGTLA
jgi:hypothetical protein